MAKSEAEDKALYKVVINHEEQYSIWPEQRELPNGWNGVGVSGPKAECLAYIERVWTDMRPLSLRKAMEEAAAAPPVEREAPVAREPEDSLPVRLSRGRHPVELALRPERTVEGLKRQIESGYLHVRFTGTRGGTELTFAIQDDAATHLQQQIATGQGPLQVSGDLTLDYVPVRCSAEIDLATLTGTGRLEIAHR